MSKRQYVTLMRSLPIFLIVMLLLAHVPAALLNPSPWLFTNV